MVPPQGGERMGYEEYDWLEEAEASDQVVWDQASLDRLENEWEPSEVSVVETTACCLPAARLVFSVAFWAVS